MKAYKIISTEYRANRPSIFVFVNGEYFGDTSYPTVRKFPKSIDYWRTATCADADRFFTVVPVSITEAQLAELRRLRDEIKEAATHLLPYDAFRAGMTKEEETAYNARQQEVGMHNWPFDHKILQLSQQTQSIINTLE